MDRQLTPEDTRQVGGRIRVRSSRPRRRSCHRFERTSWSDPTLPCRPTRAPRRRARGSLPLGSKTAVAPRSRASGTLLLASARHVHHEACCTAEHDRRSRDTAPAPWTRTDWPGRRSARLNNIRYAVSHAVGKHAASANDSPARLRHEIARGSGNALRERARHSSLREDVEVLGERLVLPGRPVHEHRVDHDLPAVDRDTGPV